MLKLNCKAKYNYCYQKEFLLPPYTSSYLLYIKYNHDLIISFEYLKIPGIPISFKYRTQRFYFLYIMKWSLGKSGYHCRHLKGISVFVTLFPVLLFCIPMTYFITMSWCLLSPSPVHPPSHPPPRSRNWPSVSHICDLVSVLCICFFFRSHIYGTSHSVCLSLSPCT